MTGHGPPGGAGVETHADAGWDVPWTWMDALVIFFGGFLLGEVGRQALVALLAPDTAAAVAPIVAALALLVVAIGWVRLRHGPVLARLLGPGYMRLRVVVAGLGHGVLASLVLNAGLAFLFTIMVEMLGVEPPPVQETLRETITDPATALSAIVYALAIAAVVEEVFFRGVLFQAVRRLGAWPAIGISGLAFGFVHYQPDAIAWMYTFVVMSAFGMYLGWAFERYRQLAVPVLMHVVWNGAALAAILRGWG